LLAGFLLNLFLRPWRWGRYVPPKRRLKLNGLHGVISQKMILFITTAVKTSNPTIFKWVSLPFYTFHFPLCSFTSIVRADIGYCCSLNASGAKLATLQISRCAGSEIVFPSLLMWFRSILNYSYNSNFLYNQEIYIKLNYSLIYGRWLIRAKMKFAWLVWCKLPLPIRFKADL
jgi:hypothetical protein